MTLTRKRTLASILPIVPLMPWLICSDAAAVTLNTPVPGYQNEIGIGFSYGAKIDSNAYFWGYAPDYLRVLGDRWLLNVSFAYDEETETKNEVKSVTESWTPSVTIGYQLSPRLALGAGIGHGLLTNENGNGWKSVKLGKDVSVAAAAAVSLWSHGRHGISLSVSLEYNINDSKKSVSADLGYGWAF